MVIRRRSIYRNRMNYSEMEGSDDYTDRFRLTSVKMEELLSVGGRSLHRETNRSRTPSEKQLLQIALYWLGTGGQYHAVGDTHDVSMNSVCISVCN